MSKKLELVKKHRDIWPQVYEYLINGTTTKFRVMCRKVGFVGPQVVEKGSLKEAITFASDLASKVKKTGVEEAAFTFFDRAELTVARRLLAPFENLTIVDAAKFMVLHQKSLVAKSKVGTVSELVCEWIEERYAGKFKNNADRTLGELKNKGELLVSKFGPLKVADLNRKMLEDSLTSKTWDTKSGFLSKRTQINYVGKWSQFFKWAIEQKEQITINPCDAIRFQADKIKKQIALLTLPKVRELLITAQKPELQMYYLLGLFAGLRPEEAQQMKWENINSHGNELIHVEAWMSKTRKDRYVRIQPTMMSWLKSMKLPSTGRLFATRNIHRNAFDFHRSGCGFRLSKGKNKQGVHLGYWNEKGSEWKQDCMRHNYGTYQLVINPDINLLALEMGNSPAVIKQDYRRPVKPNEATEYMSILPDTLKAQYENDVL